MSFTDREIEKKKVFNKIFFVSITAVSPCFTITRIPCKHRPLALPGYCTCIRTRVKNMETASLI